MCLSIQSDILNDTRINTVVMLAITSNLKYGDLPGNVTLGKGEANLTMKCVVNATQVKSVNRSCIREMIGTLSKDRMHQVQDGTRREGSC